MHCGLAIVLPDGVGFDRVEAEVARIMHRFDENRDVEPYLIEVTDTPYVVPHSPLALPGDITRMREYYQTDDLTVLAEKMQDWSGHEGILQDGKLYQRRYDNPEGRWDYYNIQSLSGCEIPNGIGYVRDFPAAAFCRALILPDGEWREREPRHQDREKGWPSYDISEWVPIFQTLISEYPDNVIVTIDTHY